MGSDASVPKLQFDPLYKSLWVVTRATRRKQQPAAQPAPNAGAAPAPAAANAAAAPAPAPAPAPAVAVAGAANTTADSGAEVDADADADADAEEVDISAFAQAVLRFGDSASEFFERTPRDTPDSPVMEFVPIAESKANDKASDKASDKPKTATADTTTGGGGEKKPLKSLAGAELWEAMQQQRVKLVLGDKLTVDYRHAITKPYVPQQHGRANVRYATKYAAPHDRWDGAGTFTVSSVSARPWADANAPTQRLRAALVPPKGTHTLAYTLSLHRVRSDAEAARHKASGAPDDADSRWAQKPDTLMRVTNPTTGITYHFVSSPF